MTARRRGAVRGDEPAGQAVRAGEDDGAQAALMLAGVREH